MAEPRENTLRAQDVQGLNSYREHVGVDVFEGGGREWSPKPSEPALLTRAGQEAENAASIE